MQFVDDLEQTGHLESPFPILLSIPSSYAIEWSRVVCRRIKQLKPDALIVVGGRWVTADDGAWVRHQIPDVDLVIFGTAECVFHGDSATQSTIILPPSPRSFCH